MLQTGKNFQDSAPASNPISADPPMIHSVSRSVNAMKRKLAQAIAAETGLAPELKHPNDVLVGGRKVAGVLAEASDGRVVLGIGVNVSQTELPAETRLPATSLRLETGAEQNRAQLVAAILNRLGPAIDEWAR